MQECESSFLLRDENCREQYHGEINVAMELCAKVQVGEYVIHVVESTNFYTQLQFSLLASTWFPRPLGVGLWSALHMLLVLYGALMLLVLFLTAFVLAVLWDAIMVGTFIYLVFLVIPATIMGGILVMGIGVALIWLWLVITCQCCTMPRRAPGQGLGHYIFTAGGTLFREDPQPAPVVQGGAAADDGHLTLIRTFLRDRCITVSFVKHVILVSFPYRRAQLGDLSREIVPWYDTTVI